MYIIIYIIIIILLYYIVALAHIHVGWGAEPSDARFDDVV